MGNEDWKKRLSDPGYRNWLKVSLALMESKEALHEFTENVIKDVHNGIKAKVGPGVCTRTPACNTNKNKAPACPSCTDWVVEIKSQSAGMLNWKNADPKIWHDTPWEIAKCFMNPQGSKTTASKNTGPAKTDPSGMLNVLVNCKEFRHHLSDKKLSENVRTVRNELMHNGTMTLSDAEMQDKVDNIIALLEDGKELKNLPICREKVKVIKSLRDSKFELQPDQEQACISTVLKSHELSVESGEGVDENMSKFLLDKVLKLIKGYQDLEEKFHDKIINVYEYVDNIKHENDAKFSSIEVQLGNLKGIVESLQAERLQNETSVPTQSKSSLLAVHEKSLFKNALQSYTQKKGLDPPNYDTLRNECTKLFVSTVSVNGQKFESEPKPSKKEAEQMAAEKALVFLARGNVMDDHNDSNESESPALEPAPVVDATSPQQKGKVRYKNRLQERAQSQPIPNPIYDSEETNDGFLSKVLFGECWYTPDVSPQKRKVDAEQKAAQFVLAILDRADDSTACPSPNKLSCSVERQQASPSPAKTLTNFKGRLREYLKKENVDPRYDNRQDQTTKKYLSKVFVGKRCFKGKDLETRKKDAESHVAKIALDALEGHTSVSDPQFKEALNTYHRKLDVTAFPKYEKASFDRGGKYSVVVKVVKKHEIPCESKQQSKRAVEVMLAEKAIRQLEGEKKAVRAGANAKSRFNLFTQLQVGAPKPDFKTSGDQSSGFTGSLIFYEVVEYESLAPQASEDEAIASAAMSACNGMDLF